MTQKPLNSITLKLVFAIIVFASWFCTASAASKQPALYDYIGLYQLRQTDPNLTGKGITFMEVCRSQTYQSCLGQNDYLPFFEHNCLNEKNLWFGTTLPSKDYPHSEHETAIASLLVGNDIAGYHEAIGEFEYEAAAPDANLFACEFMEFLTDYVFLNDLPVKTDVITMSIGTSLPDWWTRGIDALSQEGVVIVSGIGNGGDVFDPALYPAAGPNIIGVGVVDSIISTELEDVISKYWLANKQHSSSGPTDDNRCKPDIVAPGNALVANCSDFDSYSISGNYSSFSTPVVAGTCGLLVQQLKTSGYYSEIKEQESLNCLIKSILMTSAQKPAYWHKGEPGKEDNHIVPLDYLHGSGVLDAYESWDLLKSGRFDSESDSSKAWDFDGLNGFEEKVYPLNVDKNAADYICVTLVWNKHFENRYPFKALPEHDIDLRLELWGTSDGENSSPVLLDYSDSPNDNVEHIYFTLDQNYNEMEIIVVFSNRESLNKSELTQNYAISWSVSEVGKDDLFWYDLNGDNAINEEDLTLLLNLVSNASTKEGEIVRGDINQDGKIDLQDALKLRLRIANPPQK